MLRLITITRMTAITFNLYSSDEIPDFPFAYKTNELIGAPPERGDEFRVFADWGDPVGVVHSVTQDVDGGYVVDLRSANTDLELYQAAVLGKWDRIRWTGPVAADA